MIARDDERTIARCLASAAWAGERVVVLDERSRDATAALAARAGAVVVRHAYAGNLSQKNFALGEVTGDWVLALDADEALSEELSARLCQRLGSGLAGLDGLELNRVTRHLGRWLRHGDFHPDWQLRLFRRDRGRWEGHDPHGRVVVEGQVGRLAGDLEHYSYADLADQLARVRAFSRLEARALHAAGRRARVSDLWLRPAARFARAYLLKAGFRDGVPGFAVASVTAFHVFLKYAMLWDLERAGTAPR